MQIQLAQPFRGNVARIWSSVRTAAWSGLHAWKSASNFSGVAREGSFPFISSDTFRSISDIVIANEHLPRDLDAIAPLDKKAIAMVELSFIKNRGGGEPLLRWVSRFGIGTEHRLSIVMHNGDWIPSHEYLVALAEAGADVFCVNIPDGLPGVTPIPVGLENSIRRKNGVLHDFLFVHDQIRDPWASFPAKSNRVFASFKVATNPKVREPLVNRIEHSRFDFVAKRLPIKDFRANILKSKFVISPPGNGPDCYRTWEAIYLGAVPVVLKDSLAKSLYSKLPIWAIDDWDEVLTASDDDLDEKYSELMTRERDLAYFPYWMLRISQPSTRTQG